MGRSAAESERYPAQYVKQVEKQADGQLFGTASEVVDPIDGHADAGAQGLNIALRAPFNFQALQAFAEEVLPAFK